MYQYTKSKWIAHKGRHALLRADQRNVRKRQTGDKSRVRVPGIASHRVHVA